MPRSACCRGDIPLRRRGRGDQSRRQDVCTGALPRRLWLRDRPRCWPRQPLCDERDCRRRSLRSRSVGVSWWSTPFSPISGRHARHAKPPRLWRPMSKTSPRSSVQRSRSMAGHPPYAIRQPRSSFDCPVVAWCAPKHDGSSRNGDRDVRQQSLPVPEQSNRRQSWAFRPRPPTRSGFCPAPISRRHGSRAWLGGGRCRCQSQPRSRARLAAAVRLVAPSLRMASDR
jgi:hypothetical protein